MFIFKHPDLIKYKVKDKSELFYILSQHFLHSIKGGLHDYNFLDLSNLKNLDNLWYSTDYFDLDISKWDTSHIETMKETFFRCSHHFDITNWDVSNCKSFRGMFLESCFKPKDIKNWNIRPDADTTDMFNYGETYVHNK